MTETVTISLSQQAFTIGDFMECGNVDSHFLDWKQSERFGQELDWGFPRRYFTSRPQKEREEEERKALKVFSVVDES